jgi:hypothetical protein
MMRPSRDVRATVVPVLAALLVLAGPVAAARVVAAAPLDRVDRMNSMARVSQVDSMARANQVGSTARVNEVDSVVRVNEVDSVARSNQADSVAHVDQVDSMARMNRVVGVHWMDSGTLARRSDRVRSRHESALSPPAYERSRMHLGRPDPSCQVHIGDVRVAGFRSHDRWLQAAGVSAYLACKRPVRDISLQVTLWKSGLFYDHRQAQTTAKAAAGSHLGGDLTRVTCKDETTSRFFGVAHAVVYFGGRRGDAWVRSPGTSKPRCGT